MEYERIQKPSNQQQNGGFSPSKLRAILLGIEKKQKEEEELDSGFALRSEAVEIEDRGANASENCKDVDMVSLPAECSTSMEFGSGHRSRDHNLVSSRVRVQEDDSFDSDSVSSSVFEFHKLTERVPHRSLLVPPFLKPAPSKWDNAQKWIASPNRSSKGGGGGVQTKRLGLGGYGGRSFGAKVVLEVTDEVDTKRIDPSQDKKDGGEQNAVGWVSDLFPAVAGDKPSTVFENPFADSAISLSKHDSATSVQSALTFITPPTVKSVSMRDMGTEMTPIASQEASRTGTPNRSSTPTRSPNSSRPLSPARIEPASSANESAEHLGDPDKKDLSEKELKMKTRREIMVLGQQLGKTSIAAWASKEEESVETVPVGQPTISVNGTRAAAWEDAEKVKYLARFKQEEIKIQAWENHQKAKTEAEMRRIEVEVERMRARAHEKLMNQLAAARHKAEEKRAAAEAKRNQQAARTAQQAEYIRRTVSIREKLSELLHVFSFCLRAFIMPNMAIEEGSKQAKKRTKKEKTAIKVALKNICVKDMHITNQEENNKRSKRYPKKKAKKGKASEQEDSNNVIGEKNLPNDLNEEFTNPSHMSKQTTSTRGVTTCSGLSVDSRTKLEVKLNALGQPIGNNSQQLSSFVGCLTRELVPLNYDDWRRIHAVQKECYWQAVSQKFSFSGREQEAKSYILGEMGRLARANKAKFGKNLDKKPKHIDPVEWDVFVKSRTSKKFKAKSKIFKDMKAKQTLPYRGSRKGFARIEDEIYKKEGPISNDKVRLRSWIRGYEKHGQGVEDDEIIAKEILAAPPSESSRVNSSFEEDALSKVFNKHDRSGRVTAKGAGAYQTKLNAISMATSKVVELEGDICTLQGEVKDLRSLVEQQAKYIDALLKGKGLDVEEHNEEEDSDENDADSDEDDDTDDEDEDNDGKVQKIPTNTSTTPQSQNGSITCRRKKCKLLNWTTRNEVVAIGGWMTDEPDTIMHFVPLGKHASKVWVEEVLQHDAPLFRPNSSMETVGEAHGAPIAWPTDHIMMLDY